MREEDEAYVRELIAAELAKERAQQQGEQPSIFGGLGRSRTEKNEPNNGVCDRDDRDCDDELRGIRQWIDSLPDDGMELLRCMEFDILCPSLTSADGVGPTSPGASTDPGSDVLLQLLELQAPPPTPIHPRAVSYKSASCTVLGATDGRNEEDRVLRERFRRPRLFQLVERVSSGSKRNGRGKKQQQQSSGKRYDVMARKFITASGEVLSIGCTDRQKRADEFFLSQTTITHYFDEISCSGGDAAVQRMRRRCHLRLCENTFPTISGNNSRSRKERIVQIFNIVTRGRFLSIAPRKGFSLYEKFPFCAPWLDPSSQWFSLPMFLASRFETSLWKAFEQWRTEGVTVSTTLSFPDQLGDLLSTYSDVDASRLLAIAAGSAFTKLLHQEDTISGLVRDGLVWRLIDKGNALQLPALPCQVDEVGLSSGYVNFKSLLSLPLIQMGSSQDEYRHLVLRFLKDGLAAAAEKSLLLEMASEKEEEKKTEGNITFAVSNASARRRKKKRKKGKKSRGTPVLKRIDETSPAQDETSVNTNNTGAPEDDEAIILARRAHSPSLPSVGANQNTIMVLQILDGVISNVFDKVGLGAKEEDADGGHQSFLGVGEKRETKPQKQSMTFQYKRPKRNLPGTTSSVTAATGLQSTPANHQEWSHSHPPPVATAIGSHIRAQSPEDSSSISMLSYNTNPYHHPQSPHEHVFSFMDSSQSNLSNRPIAGGLHSYGSIFDDGSSPLGMALNLGSNSDSGFHQSGHIGGRWSGLGGQYPSRERSLFTDFFDKEDPREAQDIEEMLMAASTAASFASSNAYDDASSSDAGYDDVDSEIDQNMFEEEKDHEGKRENVRSPTELSAVSENTEDNKIEDQVNSACVGDENVDRDSVASQMIEHGADTIKELSDEYYPGDENVERKKRSVSVDSTRGEVSASTEGVHLPDSAPSPLQSSELPSGSQTITEEDQQRVETPSQNNISSHHNPPLTPSEPPSTPPPQLSPIQVSLADLGKFIKANKRSHDVNRDFEKATSVSSLPGSPRLDSTKRNWSRDDLTRLASMNDDTASGIRRRRRVRSSSSQNFEEVMSYRTALSKSIKGSSTCSRHEVRSVTGSVDHRFLDRRHFLHPRLSIPDMKKAGLPIVEGHLHANICARSETALDGYEDSSHVNVMRPHEEMDNATTTRDGATTISSAPTPGEPQEVSHLREERDAFRDLCLTLGAEVAKLKSTVAALQQGHNSMAYAHPQMGYGATTVPQQPYFYSAGAPAFTQQGFSPGPPGYAMSDAGIAHETTRSEDGSDAIYQGDTSGLQTQWHGDQGHPTGFIQIRRPSLSCNRTVSNASVDHDAGCHGSIAMSALRSSVHRDAFGGGVLSQGLQSRLSIDINSYCLSISSQLKKQENR